MSQALANIDATLSNGRVEILGVPTHLGGLLALLTFCANAAWQEQVRVAEHARLGGLARDFGRVLAASYLSGNLDDLIAEFETHEAEPQ